MATTAIWDIKGNLNNVLDYAKDKKKTSAKAIDYSYSDVQGLRDVMNYAIDDFKTEDQVYVTGVNCLADIARQEMQAVKKQYNKKGGIICFHAYQSFAPGETTPDEAHQIGVELAQKVWGDRFQVVVATHLDHEHLHNHFIINSVSFKDGLRYYDNKKTYAILRNASDELCRQHNLSVIEHPKSKGRHYAEWLADKNGNTTMRGLIREDIDKCISVSYSFANFLSNLEALGYTISGDKDGDNRKYITIKPEGWKRGVRLTQKSIGYGYSEEHIRERIENKQTTKYRKSTIAIRRQNPYSKAHTLRGLYYYYLYELNAIRSDKANNYRYGQAAFPFREEVIKLKQFSRESEILTNNNIETSEELETYRNKCSEKVTKGYALLKDLKEQGLDTSEVKAEIKKLNYDIKLCEQIKEHSRQMEQKKEDVEKNEERER